VVLDSADLRVVSSNTNQNREAKGPGVPADGARLPPCEETLPFSFEIPLAIGTIVRFNNPLPRHNDLHRSPLVRMALSKNTDSP